MSLTRRYFLKSAAAAAGAAAVVKSEICTAQQTRQSRSPNEKIGVAVIGCGGRGSSHLGEFSERSDAEVLYMCDVDTRHSGAKLKGVAEKQGREPKLVQDFRRALDDPAVDAISTATPNHWHSLVSIWSLQAGKHVYVEKPVSHNVWEGRQLVNWARHLNLICQCGTQSRSSPSLKEAVKWVREGNIGKIKYVIGTCYKARMSIGKLDKPLVIPPEIDYDMWCGPAAKVDLYRPKLHYDWHWDYNTGNGDMGNQGIHQMDIARWFLGEPALSPRVMSIGARVGYEDAGNTANTQIVYHDFDAAPLIFETRGLPKKKMDRWNNGDMDEYRGSDIGVIVQCENGYVLSTSNYSGVVAFDNDGNEVKKWSGGSNHFDNFLYAVRTGNYKDLNADILEGHLSSALCHTGTISYRLGDRKPASEIAEACKGSALLADSFSRMADHLRANEVDIDSPALAVGPWLEMDPKTERFTNSEAANAQLTRDYRQGYVVPEQKA